MAFPIVAPSVDGAPPKTRLKIVAGRKSVLIITLDFSEKLNSIPKHRITFLSYARIFFLQIFFRFNMMFLTTARSSFLILKSSTHYDTVHCLPFIVYFAMYSLDRLTLKPIISNAPLKYLKNNLALSRRLCNTFYSVIYISIQILCKFLDLI